MILYPMNALANDQRERLGEICRYLTEVGSEFTPTFGQYIGQTPEDTRDTNRHAAARDDERLPGELIFRKEMRQHAATHPVDQLLDVGIPPDPARRQSFVRRQSWHTRWKFLVLDEAHQYRGARGMEMGMLIRRLKQRLRAGGRNRPLSVHCHQRHSLHRSRGRRTGGQWPSSPRSCSVSRFRSTGLYSANLSRRRTMNRRVDTTPFCALWRERFWSMTAVAIRSCSIVGDRAKTDRARHRLRSSRVDPAHNAAGVPLELALCRECGQHYYVGRARGGRLQEAVRDPSQSDFGVEYYLPLDSEDAGTHVLCRRCGAVSASGLRVRLRRVAVREEV